MNDTRPGNFCTSGTIPADTRRKRCDACTAARKKHHAQTQARGRKQVRASLVARKKHHDSYFIKEPSERMSRSGKRWVLAPNGSDKSNNPQ
jgi:hypothetical protein